jgi:hypothetical protein
LVSVHQPRFSPYRLARCFLARVARGGAYIFGGGKGSRAGSGRIFAKIAFKV